jgi:23S rRNA (cytosine1962-C5)-methyltransferase
VDVSESAIKNATINFKANGLQNETGKKYRFYVEDVFSFIQKSDLSIYDLIILDPPAFAKKKSDFENAKKAYYSLNKSVAEKAKNGTIIITCSCSYYMDNKSFTDAVSSGIADAGKTAGIIHKHIHAPDHTLSIHQSEFDYLKSLVLIIN